MKSFRFSLDIFPSPIILIYAPTFEECSLEASKTHNLDIDFVTGAEALTQLVDGHVVISMLESSYQKDPTFLVHETLHAAINVLYRIGAPISYENQEMMCYLQQYIYTKCKNFLDELNAKD